MHVELPTREKLLADIQPGMKLTKNLFLQICYHTACGGTNDDESFDSIFPYRLNGCILIFRDASILQSTL